MKHILFLSLWCMLQMACEAEDSGNGDGGLDSSGGTDVADHGNDTKTPTDTGGGGDTESPGATDVDDGDSETTSPPVTEGDLLGKPNKGQYHIGPVDFAETDYHNACAPAGGYRSALQKNTGLGGEYLAGVANAHNAEGAVCDACIFIDAANGNSIVARVVTYGVEAEDGDIDVSPSVFDALNTGEYPRTMNWSFAKCPDAGNLVYEFQTAANPWWTSLWVRNPRVPITKVEVKSKNHASYYELRRAADGTLNDDKGFGEGAFTLRITAMDGQTITDTFDGFDSGELIVSSKQFE